jgi:hypothetical protein
MTHVTTYCDQDHSPVGEKFGASREKQISVEVLSCPNPIPDLTRQLFDIFRLLNQGKR